MYLLLAFALSAPIDAVEPTSLTITGGRLGASTHSLSIELRNTPGHQGAVYYRVTVSVFDPVQKQHSQYWADSRLCPKAAQILRVAPTGISAAQPPPDGQISIQVHARTYTLAGDILRDGGTREGYALRGSSGSALAWWAEELMTALSVCRIDPPYF